MSIIYDALKKVESTQNNSPKAAPKEILTDKHRIYLLSALMVCLGLFTVNILYGWLSQRPRLKTGGITAKNRPTVEKTEAVYSYTPLFDNASILQKGGYFRIIPIFTLNGVFFSGREGYALINNQIVKKGDKIEGATVAKISLDEVNLDLDGSIIKLSNNEK